MLIWTLFLWTVWGTCWRCNNFPLCSCKILINATLPILCFLQYLPQSGDNAFGLEHPYIQDPLKASQCWFLHLGEQLTLQCDEYLCWSHPACINYNCVIWIIFENLPNIKKQLLLYLNDIQLLTGFGERSLFDPRTNL